MASAAQARTQKGFLGWVERTGNRLPDPVFIFFYLIIALVIVSVICALTGVSALHPTEVDGPVWRSVRASLRRACPRR